MDAAASAKRIRPNVSACPLPEEIIEDILSRLPAKSLRRFECVSRSFHTVIASRAFQDAHFQRNIGKRKLYVKPPRFPEPFYAWQPSGIPVEKLMSASHLPQRSIFPLSNKSCHGLVLLSCHEYQTHHVWNPSTGETLTLPDRIPLGADKHAFSIPFPLVSYGLGYCSVTQQHKVVRMYCVRGSVSDAFCEVFTLNESAAYWRPLATKQLKHCPSENWRQGAVFCNGNLHFLNYNGGITTFNVTDETFGMLKLPLELQGCSCLELTELDGCLCLYICTKHWGWTPEYPFEIWLLRDYGVSGNWEMIQCFDWRNLSEGMHATLKSSCSWVTPLDVCYDGNGQKKIIFGTSSGNAFIVDPSVGVPEIMFSPDETIIGKIRDDGFPTIGLFEESLARVGNTSNKTIFSSPSMEAWSEVLSRLSARTLGRLQQVSKDWRALIKTECFAAAHLCRANLNKSPQMMFIDGTPYGFERVEYFIDTPNTTPPLIIDCLRVVCSKPCHGLNTVNFGKYDFVCNPIMGYSKVIPLDDSMDQKGSLNDSLTEATWDYNGDDIFAGRLGLGYDLETSRHVLVRLAYKERNLTTRDYKLVCKIRYIEDMFWDEVDPPPRPIANMPPAHMDGKLYWMADIDLGKRSPGYEIIMLDVGTRKFEVFQGPL